MNNKYLALNIRQFEDESEVMDFSEFVDESGDLNIEGIINSYKKEEPEVEEVEEVEEQPEDSEQPEEPEEPEVEEPEEVEEPQKRTPDQAFAEMRRQIEANEPLAKWVTDLAIQQGYENPQDMIKDFEEQKIAKEAEEKGVPVEMYQRLHNLEKEAENSKQQLSAEKFNNEVTEVKNRYNLDDKQINEVIDFMVKRGHVTQDGMANIPFEDAYILANKDNLIKEAEERGRQAYLEDKQKQQQQATPHITTNAKDKNLDDIDYSKEAIFSKYAELGIDVD